MKTYDQKETLENRLENRLNLETISRKIYQLQHFMVPSSGIKVLDFHTL
jgi:hypothetical protein